MRSLTLRIHEPNTRNQIIFINWDHSYIYKSGWKLSSGTRQRNGFSQFIQVTADDKPTIVKHKKQDNLRK